MSLSNVTFSKNDDILLAQKRYCALGLGLGLAEAPFWSDMFLSKCN